MAVYEQRALDVTGCVKAGFYIERRSPVGVYVLIEDVAEDSEVVSAMSKAGVVNEAFIHNYNRGMYSICRTVHGGTEVIRVERAADKKPMFELWLC